MNPRREAQENELLREAGFYACIHDCALIVIERDCGNVAVGTVYRVTHRSLDCSTESYLAEIGCIIRTGESGTREKLLRLTGGEVLYAAKQGERIVAVLEPGHSLCREAASGRACGPARYYCLESLQELGDTLENPLGG